MMYLILLVLAFVCFVASATGMAGVPTRVNLQSAGMAFWVLALLLGAAGIR